MKVFTLRFDPRVDGFDDMGLPGTVRLVRGACRRFRRHHAARLRALGTGRLAEPSFLASAASAAGHVIHASTFRLRTQLFEADLVDGVRA